MILLFFAVLHVGCLLAAQDNIDDNEDLKPLPEEAARAAILQRWPEATGIDIIDVAGEEDEDDADGAEAKFDAGAAEKPVPNDNHLREDNGEDKEEDKEEDEDEPETWTLDAVFTSKGIEYEVFLDDTGKIHYVYESLAIKDVPAAILGAAKAEVADAVPVSADKLIDERKTPAVVSYIVGIGGKEVTIGSDGKVLKVQDQPPDDENAGDPGADNDMENDLLMKHAVNRSAAPASPPGVFKSRAARPSSVVRKPQVKNSAYNAPSSALPAVKSPFCLLTFYF